MIGLTAGTTRTLREVLAAVAAAGWRREPMPFPVNGVGRRYVRDSDWLSVYITRPHGSRHSNIDVYGVVEFDPVSLGHALNVLASFRLVPAEHSPLYSDGLAFGCHAVTDVSVQTALEQRLDRLADVGVQAEIGDVIDRAASAGLTSEPYFRRLQLAEICGQVARVLGDDA